MKTRQDIRPFSTCTAKQLLELIEDVVITDPRDFDVWIDDFDMSIVIASRRTGMGDAIKACRVFYREKDLNKNYRKKVRKWK